MMATSCLDHELLKQMNQLDGTTSVSFIYDTLPTRSMAQCYLLAIDLCDDLHKLPIDGFVVEIPRKTYVIGMFQKNLIGRGLIMYFPQYGREIIDLSLCDVDGHDIINETLGYAESKQVKTITNVRAEIERLINM